MTDPCGIEGCPNPADGGPALNMLTTVDHLEGIAAAVKVCYQHRQAIALVFLGDTAAKPTPAQIRAGLPLIRREVLDAERKENAP